MNAYLTVGIILGALLSLVVLILFVRRVLRVRRRQAETMSMKKDLMVWKNLNSLVRGGDSTQEAKADLSSRLRQIRDLFANGLQLFRSVGKRTSSVPWFVLVGEPGSGKTSLFARSGLELRASVSPEAMAELPLVGWLGPRAYTLDVSGRTFFDRWLKGSGAEWDAILRCIRRANRKFPLSGIILTIPADALITDDQALTREKASIIGNEIQQLLKVVGMNLPCHVVVTKLDQLVGFREYFAEFTDKESASMFGWQNPSCEGTFDEGTLEAWLDGMETRLREGLLPRLLNPQVLRDPVASAARVKTAGSAYLFPDSLREICANLMTYLNRIFGKEAWNGHDQLILGGTFFTSAIDAGTCVSREFAALGVTAGATGPCASEGDGRFIGGLLNDFVFARKVAASFTSGELFLRQLPGYAAAVAIAVLGALWLATAVTAPHRMRERLAPSAAYYRSLAERFQKGDVEASPIIGKEGDGRPATFENSPMRGMSDCSRITAFCQALNAANERVFAPPGFIASGAVWFGLDRNLGVRRRKMIFNMMQNHMVFVPLFELMGDRLLQGGDEPMSVIKREALFDYGEILLGAQPDREHIVNIHSIFLYLFPEMGVDMVGLLSTYYPDTPFLKDNRMLGKLIYSREYGLAQQKGFMDLLDAWYRLDVYGETTYPKLRTTILKGNEFCDLVEETAEQARRLRDGGAAKTDEVIDWEKRLDRLSGLRASLDDLFQFIRAMKISSPASDLAARTGAKIVDKPGGTVVNALLDKFVTDPFKQSVDAFRERMRVDREDLKRLVVESRPLLKGRGGDAFMSSLNENGDIEYQALQEAFDAQVKDLNGKLVRINGLRLFDRGEKGGELEYLNEGTGTGHYEMIGDIANAVRSSRLPDVPKTLPEFFQNLDGLARSEAHAKGLLEGIRGIDTNSAVVVGFLQDVRTIMAARSVLARERLLLKYAELHPHNGDGVGEMVSDLASAQDEREVFGISAPLATEVFGDLTPASQFNPGAAETCFKVFEEMMSMVGADKGNDGKDEAAPMLTLPNRAEIEQALSEYVEDYIDYWGGFGDRLQLKCGDWNAFRKACAELKPYEVNTLLAVVYRKTISFLSSIPARCQSERQKARIAELVTTMDARIQMLTPHFSDVCIRQATNWSLLHDDPTEAYRFLRDCPASVLVGDYFAVDAEGANGNIPWWTTFFDFGLDLLKRDARRAGVERLRRQNALFLRFPFCADPVDRETVKAEDLDDVAQLLVACGFAPVVEPPPTVAPAGSDEKAGASRKEGDKARDERMNRIASKVRAPYRADSAAPGVSKRKTIDYFTWGERMLSIVETLRDRENETIWTLSLTPLETSLLLNDKHFPVLPIANYRYRYGELTVGGESRNGRVSLLSGAGVQIARGTVEDADIRIRLDAYSEPDDSVAVKLDYPGPWAILRLYLLPDSVYDAKAKAYHVPLIVRDRYNLVSVLWVTLKINRSIPSPTEWPSTSNWPDIPLN